MLAVLQEHMFREVSTLSCICGKCGKLYLTEQEVKDHMDSDHTNVVLCDICDPKFSTIDAMTVHKEATHVPPPHKIQCSKCDFKTNLMTSYWVHKIKVHDDGPFDDINWETLPTP